MRSATCRWSKPTSSATPARGLSRSPTTHPATLTSSPATPSSAPGRLAQAGVCEISGTQSGIEVMWQIVRGTARDGDYIIEEIRGQAAGNAYGYALRLIDVTRLATWYNREAADGVNAIRMGIEIDYYGRAVRYWFADTRHSAPQPVAAQNIIHRFRGIRPEQVRGIPWMHASMLSMHFVGEFALSALVAAKHGADHLGFFVAPDGDPQAPLLDGDTDERGRTITTSAPGTYDTLPMGYDVKTVDSKYPNEVFDPFVKVRKPPHGVRPQRLIPGALQRPRRPQLQQHPRHAGRRPRPVAKGAGLVPRGLARDHL